MATLLLVVIYLSFISLGVPDSLLGTAWPVLYRELGVPLASQSAVSILCSLATMTSSMNSARIISHLGTGKVTAFSTLLTAAALLGFSFSGSFWFMCLMAIPLGLGAGCVDSALNNYVSIHYNATVMSFLHCFYGVGVMVSPYIMSVVINSAVGWRGGYRTASLIQALIGSILLLALPLWKKAHGEESIQAEKKMKVLPISQTLRIPGALMTCLLFLTFCAIEVICGGWSATYMVEAKHMPANLAARATMYFYLGMALGRFLSGVAAKKLTPWADYLYLDGYPRRVADDAACFRKQRPDDGGAADDGLGRWPAVPEFQLHDPPALRQGRQPVGYGDADDLRVHRHHCRPRPLRRAGTAARHGHFPGVFDDILRSDRRRHYRLAPHAPAGGTASAMSNEQLAMKSAPADFADAPF